MSEVSTGDFPEEIKRLLMIARNVDTYLDFQREAEKVEEARDFYKVGFKLPNWSGRASEMRDHIVEQVMEFARTYFSGTEYPLEIPTHFKNATLNKVVGQPAWAVAGLLWLALQEEYGGGKGVSVAEEQEKARNEEIWRTAAKGMAQRFKIEAGTPPKTIKQQLRFRVYIERSSWRYVEVDSSSIRTLSKLMQWMDDFGRWAGCPSIEWLKEEAETSRHKNPYCSDLWKKGAAPSEVTGLESDWLHLYWGGGYMDFRISGDAIESFIAFIGSYGLCGDETSEAA